ncbi:zinc finger BED domain-containing protein 5-like [Wyeomyia smithii]|uniref:zinc finger BED domain-containing protein 5-like n=1 Tax=Wyeomyia smithii TaxID=174621 RepID=UPI0024680CF3|nr:zinc finger BED domain-containing protein 5-like [Wyeomyia smithii]XP_055544053.1 zinc finger BED domain-containing protein 5-like [Wyeomyia smithii]
MNALEASFRISYHVAKSGKAHTIAENLIASCLQDAVKCILGEGPALKVSRIPLSNSTVSRRIEDMSVNIEDTVVARVKNSKYFAIQVDESTDVSDFAVLLVIVRYINVSMVGENLLLCHALTKRTRGEDIFNAINVYFEEKQIDWKNCCGLCTDGAKSMSGCYSGLRARVLEVAPNAVWTHCCIHRQNLASSRPPIYLKSVLDESVKIVNFIKPKATKSRLFTVLCEEMGCNHTTLLLHTEVRWLSRGKVISRLFELRREVDTLFNDHPFYLQTKIKDCDWVQTLAYLSDIFSNINTLNISLQHHCHNFRCS